MKLKVVEITPEQPKKKSKHYELVSSLLEACKDGKGIEVELEDGDTFSEAGIAAHLRSRSLREQPRDQPRTYVHDLHRRWLRGRAIPTCLLWAEKRNL